MKIKFIKPDSPLYPFRWFIIIGICIASLMAYADVTGWRLFSFSTQQQWNAGGPGYHK
ncbi:MAG TPA: hypothetical protein VHK91_11425 [Flavisolibacter sp.]|nr:hypothetical protein [Flavisolibacter sp.]